MHGNVTVTDPMATVNIGGADSNSSCSKQRQVLSV